MSTQLSSTKKGGLLLWKGSLAKDEKLWHVRADKFLRAVTPAIHSF